MQNFKGYCFKGTSTLIVHTRPRATFVTYGKTPLAAAEAKEACEAYRKDFTNSGESVCQAPELIFHRECPVECDTVQMIPVPGP